MSAAKAELLKAIDRDRQEIIAFLSGFVRARSPNPPGDTREAVRYLTRFLAAEGLRFRMDYLRHDLSTFDHFKHNILISLVYSSIAVCPCPLTFVCIARKSMGWSMG